MWNPVQTSVMNALIVVDKAKIVAWAGILFAVTNRFLQVEVRRMQGFLVLALISSLLVAVFAVQNAGGVDIRFFVWTFQGVSLVLVILGSAAVGACLAYMLGMLKQVRLSLKLRETQAQVRKLHDELQKLREAPVSPPEQPVAETVQAPS